MQIEARIADLRWISPGSLLDFFARNPAGRKKCLWLGNVWRKWSLNCRPQIFTTDPWFEGYMEPTMRQSCHHTTAQMSHTSLGFWVVTAEFLPGNPQAQANDAEKKGLSENPLLAHIAHTNILHFVIETMEKSKWRSRSLVVLPKGFFPCKGIRAWFQCPIKICVDDTQDILILIL